MHQTFSLDRAPNVLGGDHLTELELQRGREMEEAGIYPPDYEKAVDLRKIRWRHHQVARLLAQGLKPIQISQMTGVQPSTIYQLRSQPVFRALVEHYLGQKLERLDHLSEMLLGLSVDALSELQGRLEEAPEELSPQMLLEILKVAADRAGHAPVNRSVNLHGNLDPRTVRDLQEDLKAAENERLHRPTARADHASHRDRGSALLLEGEARREESSGEGPGEGGSEP